MQTPKSQQKDQQKTKTTVEYNTPPKLHITTTQDHCHQQKTQNYIRKSSNRLQSSLQCLQRIPSPLRVKNLQPRQQNILITYDQKLQKLIVEVHKQICRQYASVHIIQKQNPTFLIPKHKQLLTKRPIKYLHIQKFTPELHQNLKKSTDKYINIIHYCDDTRNKSKLEQQIPMMSIIAVHKNQDSQSLFAQATKLLHLDFIWLGVAGRLGYSLQEFVSGIREFQTFSEFQVDYISQFLEVFSQGLAGQQSQLSCQNLNPQLLPVLLSQALQKSINQISEKLKQIEQSIQLMICERYNDHILVSSLTYHSYFKLLRTRNYFKLIWIQQPASRRFQQFKKYLHSHESLQHVQKWIENDIGKFLMLDDYIYQSLLLQVAYDSDFVIKTGIVKQHYPTIIQKNYKEIFRKFRPDFDEYFISICQILKIRGGCIKQAVGSVIVKDKRILSTGYNGTPKGSINCYNGGCRICNDSNKINTAVLSCNCIHAEYSCIMQAGIESTPGCILYTTQLPCIWCAKIICQAKLSVVVYIKNQFAGLAYDNQDRVFDIFKQGNVELRVFNYQEKRFSKI